MRHYKSSVACLSIKDLHNQTLWSKYLTPINPVEREEIGIITHTYTLYRYHYCSFRMTHNITYGSSYSYIGERLRYETSTLWWNNFWRRILDFIILHFRKVPPISLNSHIKYYPLTAMPLCYKYQIFEISGTWVWFSCLGLVPNLTMKVVCWLKLGEMKNTQGSI